MSQKVTQLTYARVAQGAAPGPAKTRRHDDNLDAFLLDHFNALTKLASTDDSPFAHFVNDDTRRHFETLRTGREKDFLTAAHDLTTRLTGQMTGATREGLLVCIQVRKGNSMSAAALKLQVMQPHAANLKQLDNGEIELSAVTDVMDAPGDLQKGALVDDPRTGSDVVMGDQLALEAQYFPRAFGIEIEQRAPQAAVDLLETINESLGANVEAAARAILPNVQSGLLVDVLKDLSGHVPELEPPDVRDAIEGSLRSRVRPVRLVDTGVSLTEVIRASGVTVRVPVNGNARVSVDAEDGGGYVISVHVDELPRREIQRR